MIYNYFYHMKYWNFCNTALTKIICKMPYKIQQNFFEVLCIRLQFIANIMKNEKFVEKMFNFYHVTK